MALSWKISNDRRQGTVSEAATMYILQFYLNLFSVVLAQLRLTLRCRGIDASTSTPPHLSTFTSSHAHIRRSTSPPHHAHTSAHLYHICTSTTDLNRTCTTSTLSLLHIHPLFLSFYTSFRQCWTITCLALGQPSSSFSTFQVRGPFHLAVPSAIFLRT